MTAVSFGVLLLLALALVTAVLTVLAAMGRLPLGMEAAAPLHRRGPSPAARPDAPEQGAREQGAPEVPDPSDGPERSAVGRDSASHGSAAGERPLPGARE